MSPPAPTPTQRGTRASATTVTKTRDKIVKTFRMDMKDATTARQYLINGAYVIEGIEANLEMLSTVALQLSQMPKLTKPMIEAFWALAFLMEEARQKILAKSVIDILEKLINIGGKPHNSNSYLRKQHARRAMRRVPQLNQKSQRSSRRSDRSHRNSN